MENNRNYLYFDRSGKPCKAEDAVLCVIQYLDKNGKVISEQEIEITDEK